MRNLEKMRGITLIALVVTIIVLLILAGVSLQLIGGSSGILTRASNAVDQTEIAGAMEQAEMYLTEIGFDYQEGKYVNRDVEISKLEFLQDKIGEKAELNDCQLTLDAEGNLKVTRKDGKTLLATGSINADGQVSWANQEENNQEETTIGYLVDVAEIGDYVDVGIEYEMSYLNNFRSDFIVSSSVRLTGWRVMRKNGSSENGFVTLVSAGLPLEFVPYDSREGGAIASVNSLANLYKRITVGFSGSGFRGNNLKINGVRNDNLQEVFNAGKYIDTTKGIHAFGCVTNLGEEISTTIDYSPLNEFEELLREITGLEIPMTEYMAQGTRRFDSKTLQNASGNKWKESYNDLLNIGQPYLLRWYLYKSIGIMASSRGSEI